MKKQPLAPKGELERIPNPEMKLGISVVWK